eukprot:750263-Hanusia_phi.AAC.1
MIRRVGRRVVSALRQDPIRVRPVLESLSHSDSDWQEPLNRVGTPPDWLRPTQCQSGRARPSYYRVVMMIRSGRPLDRLATLSTTQLPGNAALSTMP